MAYSLSTNGGMIFDLLDEDLHAVLSVLDYAVAVVALVVVVVLLVVVTGRPSQGSLP
jgi:NADH:ubiquinone oxidoreductase subunit 6 (subunit J)